MDGTNADKEKTPCNDFDNTSEHEKRLLKNFEEVLKIIQEDAFCNNVGEAFEKKYPKIKELLAERMEDLEKSDCGIVVLGETCTGKSTLINKLIGHDALACGVLETTGRIYRVMYPEKLKVKTYKSRFKPTEHHFNSVEELHEMLRDLEDEDTKDNTIYQVDVLLPFSKIKNGNVTFVDTPGIGDSEEYRKMLEEYIPKAVAFVIVIDVSRAGGLQKDRVLSVLSTIKLNASAMQCFDLEDTLFVRNKWDCVNIGIQKRNELRIKLTDRMRAEWPWVRESQIFDICLRKNFKDDSSEYSSQFEKFEEAIHKLINKKENIRIQTHGTYLSGVILGASEVLSEALTDIQQKINVTDITFHHLNEIMNKTEEMVKTLHSTEEQIVTDIITTIISSLYDYINSEELSVLILQEEPKLETFYKMQIDGIIHERMEKATKKWLEENVLKIIKTEFDILIQDITNNYKKMLHICKYLEGIAETDLTLSLKKEGFTWTALSGIVWASNKYFWSFFLDQEAVAFIATLGAISTLSFGALMMTKHIFKVEEVIKNSFKSRVKTMDKEKLHKLMHKKLDKGLREFHRHIFTIVLPDAIDNLSFCVHLMEREKNKMERNQNDFENLLTKIVRCQNDVEKMITSAPKV